MLTLILVIAALILFILGAIPIASRINLISTGLACLTVVYLVGRV